MLSEESNTGTRRTIRIEEDFCHGDEDDDAKSQDTD
jgi:hypothetical protein